MTEEEHFALTTKNIQKEKDLAWQTMKLLMNADERALYCAGFRNCSNADAVLSTFASACKKIEKLIVEHEKMFP